MSKISPILLARVFLPFAAGYFISYAYRVVNAVISTDLVQDVHIGPSALGLLTATYFISFASFQLPLGVLLDRFGPRKIEAILLLFAALGAYIFSQAETLSTLIVGRAFIGFGVSACLMAAFKAYATWFPREKWPLINGFQMASGGLGALAATSPVEMMLGIMDWRAIFVILAVLTLAVAVLVFFVVPEAEGSKSAEPLARQLGGIKEVFTSMKFWRTAPLTTMSQASFLAIQGLWAGPWLRDVGRFDRTESASVLFWVAVAMILGFIVLGAIAGRLNKRGISVLTTAVFGMTLALLAQTLLITLPVNMVKPIWILFGFFGTAGILSYAALSQAFPVHLSGRVTTAINLLVFVVAFIGQWAIGSIIELWPTEADGSYAVQGYRAGFGMMFILQAATLFWFFYAGRFTDRGQSENS